MPYRKIITKAYNAGVEQEYNRLRETPLREAEFVLISELLDQYIPNGATVIDIGSGPGRYAEHLVKRKCQVGVVDLSAKSLKSFSDRISSQLNQDHILFNQVSCATQLEWIDDNIADAVLLMGPLYHLIDSSHRNRAIEHCTRILKPGGILFSVFLSPFPVMNQLTTPQSSECNENTLANCGEMITYTTFMGYEVPQYRCWPWEAVQLMTKHGLTTLRIRNIEGIFSHMTDKELTRFTSPHEKIQLIDILRTYSEKPSLSGHTHQYLYVGCGPHDKSGS